MKPMPDDWKTYRTRFLVRAKRLTEPLTFIDPLGREHRGLPGDYLVQSCEGLSRIAPREIFEDVYVVLEQEEEEAQDSTTRRRPQYSLIRNPIRNQSQNLRV